MNVSHGIAFGTIAGFALGFVTSVAIGGTGLTAGAAVHESNTAVVCVSEDSPGPCYWDATSQGNGTGTSFVRNADQSTTYLPEPTPEQEYVAAIRFYEGVEQNLGVEVGFDTDAEVAMWGHSICEQGSPDPYDGLLAAQYLCTHRLPEFQAKVSQSV